MLHPQPSAPMRAAITTMFKDRTQELAAVKKEDDFWVYWHIRSHLKNIVLYVFKNWQKNT